MNIQFRMTGVALFFCVLAIPFVVCEHGVVNSSDLNRILKIENSRIYYGRGPLPPQSFRARNHAMVAAIRAAVPGWSTAQVKRFFGTPRAFDRARSAIEGWPEAANSAEEIWLYMMGDPAWGPEIVMCFNKGICSRVEVLSIEQEFAYNDWKTKLMETIAPGKTAPQIQKQFGPPIRREFADPAERDEPTQFGEMNKNTPIDQMWRYEESDSGRINIGFKNGKCVAVQTFITMH